MQPFERLETVLWYVSGTEKVAWLLKKWEHFLTWIVIDSSMMVMVCDGMR